MNIRDSAFLSRLNKSYFWDVDFRNLEPCKSKRLIIERVLSLGNLEEMKLILDFYGDRQVASEVQQLNYIDPKSLHFLSLFFNIPLNKFKCYTRTSSKPAHWSS